MSDLTKIGSSPSMIKKTRTPADPPRQFIRQWRTHRGLTQAQLAERIGMARSYLTKIERGARRYDQTFMESAAAALECTVGDLIGRSPGDPEDVASLWASLSADERIQALSVLKALFGERVCGSEHNGSPINGTVVG